MVRKALSASVVGIDANVIHIEVDLIPTQLSRLVIVGLPDKTVQKSK